MQKPHPVQLDYLCTRAATKGVEFRNYGYGMKFDFNSFSLQLILSSESLNEVIKPILYAFISILKKYKGKHFFKLHLNFDGCQGLDKNVLHMLGSEIANHFKNIRELTMQFFRCNDMTDGGIKNFLQPLSKTLRRVRKLNIELNCCGEIGDAGIGHIRSLVLHRCKSLKEFTLKLPEINLHFGSGVSAPLNSNIIKRFQTAKNVKRDFFINGSQWSEESVLLLSKSVVRYLKQSLEQLNLEFSCFDMNQGYKLEQMIIKNLNKLNRLHVSFFYDPPDQSLDNKDELYISIASSIGQNLHALESLTLDLQKGNIITDQILRHIASQIFPNVPLLRKFALSCEGIPDVTDEGIIFFASEMIKHTKDLVDLIFCIQSAPKITNQAIRSIIQHINKNLPSLRRVTFGFQSTQVDGEEIQFLSSQRCQLIEELNLFVTHPKLGINTYFTNLRRLTLSFDDCSQMTDSKFQDVVNSIFRWPLSNLPEFTLRFLKASLVTDDGFAALWEAKWSLITNLQSFKFELSSNNLISDMILGITGFFIKKEMKDLRDLTLIFKDCDSITRDGVKFLLLNIIKSLKKLQSLNIDIFNKKEGSFWSESFIEITEKIALNLKALKRLNLRIGYIIGCMDEYDDDGLPDDVISRIYKNLKFIPTVTIF